MNYSSQPTSALRRIAHTEPQAAFARGALTKLCASPRMPSKGAIVAVYSQTQRHLPAPPCASGKIIDLRKPRQRIESP
jgi:hypothetical protein